MKKNAKTLPKTLPGVVCVQWIRCGKPNCRCVRGQRHKAHYRFFREGGRLRKAYVPRHDLAGVQAACQTRIQERHKQAEGLAEWRDQVANTRKEENRIHECEATMNELPTHEIQGDSAALAREMANHFGQMIRFYQERFNLTCEEAIGRINENPTRDKERILKSLPDEISWIDLHQLGNVNPAMALKRWEEIKCAALEEIQTGHRGAKAIETSNSSPWDRAQFLALRKDLADEWQPRNGLERHLIDIMAQAQSSYFHWFGVLTVRTSLEKISEKRSREEEHRWQGPRLGEAEAIEQAAEMADRFNRIFLRNLRAFRELRRYQGPAIVQNGGQMNVANQQKLRHHED